MKTTKVKFKNRPTDGGVETVEVSGCLVANNGSPNVSRPQILIHLPKAFKGEVDGSFVDYDGEEYHVVGTTAADMDENTPTKWDRYAIAERIIAL